MAHYYITDCFSTWNVADPSFPEELPAYGERIYLAIVDGPVGQNSTKSLSTVYEGQYMGLDWLKNWYKELHRDPAYGPNATIIWVKIPPKPLLPEEWKVCGPTVCEDHHCDGYDNGYCMSDDGDHCPKAKVHKEFSIIRHAKKPQQCNPATTSATPQTTSGVDTYNMPWRNAFVYWVDWEQEKIGVRIGEDHYFTWSFKDVAYSATDDTQAIKMILDRMVTKWYRTELSTVGSTSCVIMEYVADILANPYEWGTKI